MLILETIYKQNSVYITKYEFWTCLVTYIEYFDSTIKLIRLLFGPEFSCLGETLLNVFGHTEANAFVVKQLWEMIVLIEKSET